MTTHDGSDVAGTEVPVPALEGRWVRLRTIRPPDTGWVYDFSLLPELGFRWRHLPGSVDPAQFAQRVASGVTLQLLVEDKRRNEKCGLMVCYSADFPNRSAYIAAAFHPSLQRVGWPLEALDLFIRYCFSAFDFRKLYAEVLDFNSDLFASAPEQRVHQEGLLRQHWWVGGRYRDVALLSFYREDWDHSWDDHIRKRVQQALTAHTHETV